MHLGCIDDIIHTVRSVGCVYRAFGQNCAVSDLRAVGDFIFLFSPQIPAQLHEERNGSCNRKIPIKKESILIEKGVRKFCSSVSLVTVTRRKSRRKSIGRHRKHSNDKI